MIIRLSPLRFFFHLIYHQLAWTYDLVAAVVSLGRWKGWVQCALPYVKGRVLEIGYGPGHLQVSLHQHGFEAYGLDESRQMSRQAGRRLKRRGFHANLVRGLAGGLPFPSNSFETVAATFPSETIFAVQALAECRRVLVPGGRLVIIPTAWITGSGRLERLAAWLFQVTGEVGSIGAILPGMRKRLKSAGLEVRHELVETRGSRVLVLLATKT